MSGLSRTPGKRVWVNSPPRVRIPPSPPHTQQKCPSRGIFISRLIPTKGDDACALTDDSNLVALAVLEGEQRQGAVFHIALFIKADGACHALVTAGFGQRRQVLGRV
jgi:hypothetical protein